MKLTILAIIAFLSVNSLFSQTINLDRLFKEQGKSWKFSIGPDDAAIDPDRLNDVFIFFPNNKMKFENLSIGNVDNINWTFDVVTNMLLWNVKLKNNKQIVYQAEIIDLFDNRIVTNLSIDGKEPVILVLVTRD